MADEAAVLDAPVLETEPIELDPAVEPVPGAEPEAEPVAEVKGDARRLPAEIKALKDTDPAAYKQAKAEFFGDLAYRDGLGKEVDQIRSFLEEKGGVEGISQAIAGLEAKAQELDSINQAITEGKTEILDSIPAESLAKLAPAVAQRWAEADPEGWGKAMSGIMAATIQSSGIPAFLNEMAMMLKYNDTETFGTKLQQLQEWAQGFQKQAAAPLPQRQTAKAPDVNQERQQWEQEKFTTALTTEVETIRSQQIEKSLETFISRRPNDADAKGMAVANVRQQVIERLSKDTDFQKSLNALVARKDKDGALRLVKSRETAAIQEIAPKVGRTIFGNPAAVVQEKKAATAKAEVGFSFTDKPPRPELIDRRFTSDAMIMRGKFVLKDGSKLTLEA